MVVGIASKIIWKRGGSAVKIGWGTDVAKQGL